MEPIRQIRKNPSLQLATQEEKGIEVFKSLKVPNLEKIISHSKSIFTDLLRYSGEIWNKNKEMPAVQSVPESSSSEANQENPQFIILQRMSTMNHFKTFHSSPKKIRVSKSFAPSIGKSPDLVIEDDVQSQVRSIKGESFVNEGTSIVSQNNYLNSTLYLNTSDMGRSVGHKDVSILPGLFNSILEDDEKSEEKNDRFLTETKTLASKTQPKEEKKTELSLFNGIPEVFEVDTYSDIKSQKSNQKIKYTLETEYEKQEKILSLEEEIKLNHTRSLDDSLEYLCKVIPRAILYQLPILTFEEFVNSLMNDEIKSKKALWTGNCSRKWMNFFCCFILNSDDYLICEKIIDFKLASFSFQNSLHLILLLSCYKSASRSDKWPVKEGDWYEMGFTSENIEKDLKNNGTVTLLNIFFLSSYFPKLYSEMLRVRSYYSFDLYEIISSVSEIVINNLRKYKMNKLIKTNGRALEVIFFYFAGVMIYWFRKLIKCKNYFKIYQSTARKASGEMNSLLKEAWRVYLENNVN